MAMRILLRSVLCVSLLAAFAVPASAIDVTARIFTDTADPILGDGLCGPGPGDTNCSLRAAIQEANASTNPDELHIIRLLAGRYVLSIAGGGEDASATGDLDITANNMLMFGLHSTLTFIVGDGTDRVFHLRSGFITIRNLTIQGGSTSGDGGGVWNTGAFLAQLDGVTLTGNHAARGAAFAASSITDIRGSLIVRNSSTTCGGGISVGGIDAGVALRDSTVRNNTSTRGGGVCVSQPAFVSLFRTIVSNNDADAGGGIFAESDESVSVTLTESYVIGNRALRFEGGGIVSRGLFQLVFTRIWNNQARGRSGLARGGGIFNAGRLYVADSSVLDNHAEGSFVSGGGGIFNVGSALVIDRSTLARNSAGAGGGGGILDARTDGMLQLTNTTISGNSARLGGGGIFTTFGGASGNLLNHVTIAENISDFGAAVQGPENAFTTVASVIGQNHGRDPDRPGQNCWRPAIDNFRSVADDGSCGFPLVLPVLLEPLAYNGGIGPTHALIPGSPAIDRSDDCGAASLAAPIREDQRRVPRPQGIYCDSGAYELRLMALALRLCCGESLFDTLAGTSRVESLAFEITQAAVASKNPLAIVLAEELMAQAGALSKAFDTVAASADPAAALQQFGVLETSFEGVVKAFTAFNQCCGAIAKEDVAALSSELQVLLTSIPALKAQVEVASTRTPLETVVARVQKLGLAKGLTNSLVKQLEAHSFEAVIQHLSALRGKAIDVETANGLIADVRILIGL
jgi:CSLREA domain-containing protein